MIYGYVPWPVGREEKIDRWGLIRWVNGKLTTEDFKKKPPMDTLVRRLDDLCSIKAGRGIEWCLYTATMLLEDGLGSERFLTMAYDDSAKLTEWLEHFHRYVVEQLEIVLTYPVEVVQLSHWLADKNGQICGNEHLARFHFPYLQRLVDIIHQKGVLASLHCDGKLDKLYPEIIRIGFDCINGYDGGNFDRDLKTWGTRIGMRGSIPCDKLSKMTPAQVKKAVQHAKRLPAHVIASTHDFPEVNPELFVAMVEAYHDNT